MGERFVNYKPTRGMVVFRKQTIEKLIFSAKDV